MAIKKLQQNFTTTEQSKLLLELGLPANSADCYHNRIAEKPYILSMPYSYSNWDDKDNPPLPCWSVGRLIEIIMLCHKQGILFFSSIRIYKTDVLANTLIEYLIKYMPDMDFSKLED